jgi:hypothetical protein
MRANALSSKLLRYRELDIMKDCLTKTLTQYARFSLYQFIINEEKGGNEKIRFDSKVQAPDS